MDIALLGKSITDESELTPGNSVVLVHYFEFHLEFQMPLNDFPHLPNSLLKCSSRYTRSVINCLISFLRTFVLTYFRRFSLHDFGHSGLNRWCRSASMPVHTNLSVKFDKFCFTSQFFILLFLLTFFSKASRRCVVKVYAFKRLT